ncbi:MAG: murein biosynthesis integral membrane protein MurJ [Deltaproteobacteria bacterium]|nr:murein biosynthesis integral membrane protein MurJ [Deltaproteobacteria bacterium]
MSENRQIVRAAGVVGGLTLASRVSGLLRDAVTAHFFGAGPAADAFFVAFRLPNLLRRLVGEGAMSVAFVPVFSRLLARGIPSAADAALGAAAGGFGAILLGLTLLGIAGAPAWLALLAPGFAADPATEALAISLTRWLFPYLLLICLAALYGAYLNARRHFLAPALSPVLLNLAIIAAAATLTARLGVGALVAGVLLGGALQLGLQLVALRADGVPVAPRWQPGHPALRRMLRLLAPTTIGAAMYQINVMLSTSLASLLPTGSVSALWYAGRLFEFPIGLVAVAIGTAALPSFAAQAARGARDEMRDSFGVALALINYLAVPASIALWLLAEPITAVLFQRGAFDATDVLRTAGALQAYAVGLWALSLVRVAAPAFYALGDVRTPLWAAGAAFVANAVASLALLGPLPPIAGSRVASAIAAAASACSVAALAHVGLALAASLAALVNAAWLLGPLARRMGGFPLRAVLGALARSHAASLPMALVLLLLRGGVEWTASGGLVGKLAWLSLLIAAGGAAFALTALVLGGSEALALRRAVQGRLKRGAPN